MNIQARSFGIRWHQEYNVGLSSSLPSNSFLLTWFLCKVVFYIGWRQEYNPILSFPPHLFSLHFPMLSHLVSLQGYVLSDCTKCAIPLCLLHVNIMSISSDISTLGCYEDLNHQEYNPGLSFRLCFMRLY